MAVYVFRIPPLGGGGGTRGGWIIYIDLCIYADSDY